MASATIPAHTRPANPPWRRVRNALTVWAGKGAKMASAARHRFRRPALVVGGLGCFDAAAYQGPLWVGLVVTGFSLWALDYLLGSDE